MKTVFHGSSSILMTFLLGASILRADIAPEPGSHEAIQTEIEHLQECNPGEERVDCPWGPGSDKKNPVGRDFCDKYYRSPEYYWLKNYGNYHPVYCKYTPEEMALSPAQKIELHRRQWEEAEKKFHPPPWGRWSVSPKTIDRIREEKFRQLEEIQQEKETYRLMKKKKYIVFPGLGILSAIAAGGFLLWNIRKRQKESGNRVS